MARTLTPPSAASEPTRSPLSGDSVGAKLGLAALMLGAGLICIVAAAEIGEVHLNAGDIKVVMGRGDDGFTMDIVSRTCPPNCGFDVNWRPLAR
jgi:hypothetical protein